jgi:predicted enzyme related to lactoylglutathione lyase
LLLCAAIVDALLRWRDHHCGRLIMLGLLVNIDVPDLGRGERFYTAALGLHTGRRLGDGFLELLGASSPIYLLEKPPGSAIAAGHDAVRHYDRHWSPVHVDVVVDDLDAAVSRALAAGAVQGGETADTPYGRLAMFGDPFGHGFCLIQFNAQGYDAIAHP